MDETNNSGGQQHHSLILWLEAKIVARKLDSVPDAVQLDDAGKLEPTERLQDSNKAQLGPVDSEIVIAALLSARTALEGDGQLDEGDGDGCHEIKHQG
jgi:hypothetical protein